MERTIDLNCDLGEGFGVYSLAPDRELLRYVSSANVACGFHAGDPATMRRTVALARSYGVAVGAHVGYRDLEGFGRRHLEMRPRDLVDETCYQIGALDGICRVEGIRLQHVKPHGALYNRAMGDAAVAEALAEAVRLYDAGLLVFAQPGSALAAAARRKGLQVAHEVFADRGYRPDGSLVPRGEEGALVTGPGEVARRAVKVVLEGKIPACDGQDIMVDCQTLCVHGDTAGSLELLRAIRAEFDARGIAVRAPGRGQQAEEDLPPDVIR